MDVKVSGASDAGGEIFFDTNGYNGGGYNGNTIMGRAYCKSGDCTGNPIIVDKGFGLVTEFDTSTIPEPSFLYLLGAAMALLGITRKVCRD
jgi:hypothetical protein